ncbi:hypothetical protein J437_LFUL011555 [Ladona fulva]|uniref:Uncharacterized protein n=1 Tax=Ladona fulva TaxID=123851 RepID=A0A8K0P3A3_LADFU|nr:hypothetical protein J437_LFUL011555 [Ladona fulva]
MREELTDYFLNEELSKDNPSSSYNHPLISRSALRFPPTHLVYEICCNDPGVLDPTGYDISCILLLTLSYSPYSTPLLNLEPHKQRVSDTTEI